MQKKKKNLQVAKNESETKVRRLGAAPQHDCRRTNFRPRAFLSFPRRRWLCPARTITLLEITETPGHSDSYPCREVESGSLIVWG